MAAATIQVQVYHGPAAGPTVASAEGGILYNRSDDEAATLRLPVPATGPNSVYSNWKALRLAVTVLGTTTITNIGFRLAAALPSGAALLWPGAPDTSYVQCTGVGATQGNRPADSSAALSASPAPNVPGSFALVPLSAAIFDTDVISTATTGVKGKLVRVLAAASQLYAGGSSAGQTIPALIFQYDEA